MAASIVFGIIAVNAKRDSAPSSDNQQDFADILDLRKTGLIAPHVATGEDYQWLLDGSYELFPDAPETVPNWGWFSVAQSDENGVFSTVPGLMIAFTRTHSSTGITLCWKFLARS